MRKLALLFLVILSAFASAADQVIHFTTLAGDQRQAIQTAIYATKGIGTVTAPSPDNYTVEPHWDSTVFLQSDPAFLTTQVATSYCRVSLVLPGHWRYNGTGPAIRSLGSKDHQQISVNLRLSNSNSTGLLIDGDTLHQSQNAIWIHDSQISFSGVNCIGYQIGSPTSNDVSDCVFERCAVWSEVFGEGSQTTQLARVHASGNRGFQFVNGNTCHHVLRDCTASGCDVQVATASALPSGGAGLVIQNLGGSFNCLGVLNDGAFDACWDGGREELGCRLWTQGTPGVAGQGCGSVSIRNVECDSFLTSLSYWGDAGSLIGWYANGFLTVENVNGYGNDWSVPRFAAVRSNLAPGPSIALAGVFNKNVSLPGQPITVVTSAGIVPLSGSLSIAK